MPPLANAIDEKMASYFPFENAKEFIRLWASHLPGGLKYLQKEGIWVDEQSYVPKNNSFQFHLERLGRKPVYRPIMKHKEMSEEEFVLTTFKWNVHTQSLTVNQQWLTEIVGDNPCWIHPQTAEKYSIGNGQLFQLINGEHTLEVKALVTEAIHPRVHAVSASFGHWQYGRTAKGKGVNPNSLITNRMDPVAGGQSWNDTIVTLRVED